jgi:serine/threonine protein phosphatase PrpC
MNFYENVPKKPVPKSQNPSGRNSPVLQNPSKDKAKQKPTYKEGKNCVRKFAFATRVGYHPHNPNKVNQDQYILAPNVGGYPSLHIFGICDGHGQFGREVSNFVKVSLPVHIEKLYGKKDEDSSQGADPYFQLKQALKASFLMVNTELENHVPNCQFSGTTCSIVVTRGPQIVSANTGDSRAIIVDKAGNCKQLSRDHKPDSADEKRRILEKGGRVKPLVNHQMGGIEVGPARVWLQDIQVPGLAMSRSIGDYVAQSVGVTPDPGK